MSEERYGATEAGTVVLEIGALTGALVLRAPADLAYREIEISPAHEPARRRHTCVRERHGADGIGYARRLRSASPAGTRSGTTAPPRPRPSRSWAARSRTTTGPRARPARPAKWPTNAAFPRRPVPPHMARTTARPHRRDAGSGRPRRHTRPRRPGVPCHTGTGSQASTRSAAHGRLTAARPASTAARTAGSSLSRASVVASATRCAHSPNAAPAASRAAANCRAGSFRSPPMAVFSHPASAVASAGPVSVSRGRCGRRESPARCRGARRAGRFPRSCAG